MTLAAGARLWPYAAIYGFEESNHMLELVDGPGFEELRARVFYEIADEVVSFLRATNQEVAGSRPAGAHHTFRGTHMSDEDLKAEVEKLRAENERLKTQRGRSVSLKVSEKGGVSVYGLGRFPVTLYKEQWTKLLAMTDEIRAFLKEHDAELKAKPEA